MFSKVDINGDRQSPLYAWLMAQAPGLLGTQAVKWNFTKFLVDRAGDVIGRFAPSDNPENMRSTVVAALKLA